MIYKLQVYDVFKEILIMVRTSLVSSLFKFYLRGLVFLLFIIYENFIKFSVKALVLALKKWLKLEGHWHKTYSKKIQSHGGLVMDVVQGLDQ